MVTTGLMKDVNVMLLDIILDYSILYTVLEEKSRSFFSLDKSVVLVYTLFNTIYNIYIIIYIYI
jgi:hypothetical protein